MVGPVQSGLRLLRGRGLEGTHSKRERTGLATLSEPKPEGERVAAIDVALSECHLLP